jgi:DNA helicase-2/ATP-dependent DNA helicase PcrA
VNERRATFTEAMVDHHVAEERRLMYVAITRAKKHLLLSGSYWAHQKSPRNPSRFLTELSEAGIIGTLPDNPFPEERPAIEESEQPLWPGDPLGSRREIVERAAGLVRAAQEQLAPAQEPDDQALRDIGAELREQSRSPIPIQLPVRISASSLERLLSDPDALRADRARPIPQKPHRAALRGTLFHQFVEDHFDVSLPGPRLEMDAPSEEDDSGLSIEQWRKAFLSSQFPLTTPVAVEAELHLPIGEHLVICKIDAVFETPDGVHIVDWKTGRQPTTPEEQQAKAWQLAAYRLAWAQWAGIDPENIQASFWYAETSELVTPPDLPTGDEFARRLQEAMTPAGSRQSG